MLALGQGGAFSIPPIRTTTLCYPRATRRDSPEASSRDFTILRVLFGCICLFSTHMGEKNPGRSGVSVEIKKPRTWGTCGVLSCLGPVVQIPLLSKAIAKPGCRQQQKRSCLTF